MPYWIVTTLNAAPAVLWMIIGVGLPWALATLPRRDWRDRAQVACLALAFGPAWVTAWMLVLGMIGARDETATLTPLPILAGTVVIAVIGAGLALIKSRTPVERVPREPLRLDERLIVGLILAALVLRWLTAAYWPFTHYDPLWVYGYQGRLYTLLGYIPNSIDYYPQFLQLSYAYTQIVTGIGVDDHTARVVIPYLHLGSILAVYLLGTRLFTRRVGIFAAGIWALYPHVGEWAHVGDLEIPVTFGVTGAAAFFLTAWHETTTRLRRQYAVIAGLFFGIALWTKPTAGALALGVMLVVALDLVLQRLDWRAWLPRFEAAVIMGLCCLPLGGVWYLRNWLLGYDAVRFPNDFWHTQALQSGSEFGWLVLALGVLLLFLIFRPVRPRPNWLLILVGLGFIAAALLPTIITPYAAIGVPRRMQPLEWVALAIGAAIIVGALWRYQGHSLLVRRTLWVYVLALPYFVVWFVSYSYHYRLSFPIVPLLLLPIAVILAHWFDWDRFFVQRTVVRRRLLRGVYLLAILAAAVPGIVVTLYSHNGGWDWLWSDEFPDDFQRLASFNYGLAYTVKTLQDDIAARGIEDPVIVAPGLERLPFFFPLEDVRVYTTPTRLEDLEGVDYYLYSQEAHWYYAEMGQPQVNPVSGARRRSNVLNFRGRYNDTSFLGEVYRVLGANRRFRPPEALTEPGETVVFGDVARFTGYQLINNDPGNTAALVLELGFEALTETESNYTVAVELFDGETLIGGWTAYPAADPYSIFPTYYSTRFWQTGEHVLHWQFLQTGENTFVPPGDYRAVISLRDGDTLLPVTVDGSPADDRYTFDVRIRLPNAP